MSKDAARKVHRLTAEDRYLIREMTKERVKLRYEMDLASITRRELLDRLRYKLDLQRACPELTKLESRIDELEQQLTRVSAAAVADKFDIAPNTVTALTTVRFR